MPVILAIWEGEAGGSQVQGQPRQPWATGETPEVRHHLKQKENEDLEEEERLQTSTNRI
jgi:hypothetical protein